MQSTTISGGARQQPLARTAAPTGPASPADTRGAGLTPDSQLAAAGQLRSMATAAPRSTPLDLVPTSMFPMGSSNWDAVAHILIISKDLGAAAVNRNATQITVDNPQANAIIKLDDKNPNLVDVAIHMGGDNPDQTYQGTLKTSAGGFTATTTDGKTIKFVQDGRKVDITGTGWPQVPSGAKLVLSPQ